MTVRARAWGNSVGVILPKELGITVNEEVVLNVTPVGKRGKVRDVFGAFKKKSDTKRILGELDAE